MPALLQALTRHNNPLLALLGIVPHRIVPENERHRPSWPLVTMDHVDLHLKRGVEVGIYTDDEASALHGQAVAAGLLTDWRALIMRALDHQVEGALDNLSFRMCGKELCATLPGLGHGQIFVGDEQVTDPINSVHDLFEDIQELVGEKDPILTPQQGVLLMRQARELGLPLDEAEQDERYAVLPEETRKRYEQSRGGGQQKQIDELLGTLFGGPVMVIEMRIER